MRLKAPSILLAVAVVLACGWYMVEPWAVTFIDDGPYFSSDFSQPIDGFPVHSQVELRRFGRLVYTLESRLLAAREESVLVLRNTGGTALWTQLPVKSDGELGPLELRRAYLTWYGGWRVRIVPAFQESGDLYLGFFGGFRFFNHSW